MTQQSGGRTASNLLLVCLLAVTMLFTAFDEGYFGIITWPFALILLGGVGMMVWLSLIATPARFLSLVITIFTIEYIKEALGIYYGFWIYHGRSFVFGVWAWVLAGLTCNTVATHILAPLLRKLPHPRSRRWNAALLVGFAILGLVLLGGRVSQAGWLYWTLYAVLLILGLLRSAHFDFPLFAGFTIAAWALSNLSEYLGAYACGAWTFPQDPSYPPFFLLFACWPIEIIAQASVATLLVEPSTTEIPLLQGDPS